MVSPTELVSPSRSGANWPLPLVTASLSAWNCTMNAATLRLPVGAGVLFGAILPPPPAGAESVRLEILLQRWPTLSGHNTGTVSPRARISAMIFGWYGAACAGQSEKCKVKSAKQAAKSSGIGAQPDPGILIGLPPIIRLPPIIDDDRPIADNW